MRATTLTALLLGGAAAAFAMVQAPADSDLFWHLASGDWMLEHRALLERDIWSFTKAGTPYAIGAWLGQVALALVYRGGGWLGIDLLRALLVGVFALFTARLVLRAQPHPGWAAVPLLGTILVSRMIWGDRPQLFTLALFPIVLDLCLAVRGGAPARRLALLPPLFLLWANLHNAFVIGLVVVAIFTVEALLAVPTLRRSFILAMFASFAASQLNPSGLGAVGRAAAYAGSLPGWVVEERPLDIRSGPGIVLAALLLCALAAALVRQRGGVAARLGAPLLWAGLIPPFVVLALAIQRNTPYACVIIAPFVAAMVPDALRRRPATAPRVPRAALAATAGILTIGIALEAALVAPRAPDLTAYPAGAVAALPSAPGRLLNEYDWGGFLIWYAPDRPVFIDGRGAALFVPGVLADFQRAVSGSAGYAEVLARWDIAAVLLRPDRPLVTTLRQQGWRMVAGTERWVLLARP